MCRAAQQAAQVTQLQGQLQAAQAALQEWVGTFEEERQGIFSGVVGQIHPVTVLNELRRSVGASSLVAGLLPSGCSGVSGQQAEWHS